MAEQATQADYSESQLRMAPLHTSSFELSQTKAIKHDLHAGRHRTPKTFTSDSHKPLCPSFGNCLTSAEHGLITTARHQLVLCRLHHGHTPLLPFLETIPVHPQEAQDASAFQSFKKPSLRNCKPSLCVLGISATHHLQLNITLTTMIDALLQRGQSGQA